MLFVVQANTTCTLQAHNDRAVPPISPPHFGCKFAPRTTPDPSPPADPLSQMGRRSPDSSVERELADMCNLETGGSGFPKYVREGDQVELIDVKCRCSFCRPRRKWRRLTRAEARQYEAEKQTALAHVSDGPSGSSGHSGPTSLGLVPGPILSSSAFVLMPPAGPPPSAPCAAHTTASGKAALTSSAGEVLLPAGPDGTLINPSTPKTLPATDMPDGSVPRTPEHRSRSPTRPSRHAKEYAATCSATTPGPALDTGIAPPSNVARPSGGGLGLLLAQSTRSPARVISTARGGRHFAEVQTSAPGLPSFPTDADSANAGGEVQVSTMPVRCLVVADLPRVAMLARPTSGDLMRTVVVNCECRFCLPLQNAIVAHLDAHSAASRLAFTVI
jgi:hypothetical protein